MRIREFDGSVRASGQRLSWTDGDGRPVAVDVPGAVAGHRRLQDRQLRVSAQHANVHGERDGGHLFDHEPLPADVQQSLGAWLLGPKMTQADITVACASTFLHEALQLDASKRPALAALVARCEALPEFKAVHQPFFVPKAA